MPELLTEPIPDMLTQTEDISPEEDVEMRPTVPPWGMLGISPRLDRVTGGTQEGPSPETMASILERPEYAPSANASRKAGMVADLQQRYGNAYVQRVMGMVQARRIEPPAREPEEGVAGAPQRTIPVPTPLVPSPERTAPALEAPEPPLSVVPEPIQPAETEIATAAAPEIAPIAPQEVEEAPRGITAGEVEAPLPTPEQAEVAAMEAPERVEETRRVVPAAPVPEAVSEVEEPPPTPEPAEVSAAVVEAPPAMPEISPPAPQEPIPLTALQESVTGEAEAAALEEEEAPEGAPAEAVPPAEGAEGAPPEAAAEGAKESAEMAKEEAPEAVGEEAEGEEAPSVPAGAAAAEGERAPASPEEDPAFQAVVARSEAVAAQQGHNTPAQAMAAQAQAAAVAPNEVSGIAAANQVAEMNQQQPKPFDSASFEKALLAEINKITPRNLKEANEFKQSGKVGTIKGTLSSSVKESKDKAQGDIKDATEASPDPSGIQPKPVTPLPPADAGPAPPDIGAVAAAPKPKTAAEISMEEGSQSIEQRMAEANVTDEQLQKSNEPEFTGALDAKDEAKTHAQEAPIAYREGEQAVLADAKAQAMTSAETQIQGMHGVRRGQFNQIGAQQQHTKTGDETTRSDAANRLTAIYKRTEKAVKARLDELDQEVNEKFDTEAEKAKQDFEDYVDQRMFDYKLRRYAGSLGVLWIKDELLGVPDEVNVFYDDGRKRYIQRMTGVIREVSIIVATGLDEAMALIADGRKEIENVLKEEEGNLELIGSDAVKNIQAKFNQLEQDVHNKQDELKASIYEKYEKNLAEIDKLIEQKKEENKGLVDKAKEQIEGVLAIIDKMKALLSQVANAVDLILKDPIGFGRNLATGIGGGFQNFAANIGTHLQKGFMQWLFGAFAQAGIQLPESFDLKGILSLALQVLGLTYANIRARAVAIVGEPIVRALEQAAEIFKILITEGPAGLWQWIKDKVGDLKSMVIDSIKDFIIEKVIVAGITWVIGLLNPAGAFVKACKAIYDMIMFVVNRASQIAGLVSAVVDAITAIASGAVGAVASAIENALASAIPVLIGFLASLLGVSGISEKIRAVIQKIQAPINNAIDWVIGKAVKLVKAAGKLLGIGKKDEETPETDDPEHDAKVTAGLAAIDQEEQKYLEEGEISREDAEKIAAKVLSEHPVFGLITVVDGGGTWDYDYVASPGKKKKGERKKTHKEYYPQNIVVESDEEGTEITYTTRAGKTFVVRLDPSGMVKSIKGHNLQLKSEAGIKERGYTARAGRKTTRLGLHSAHLIADQFMGSGYKAAANLAATSDKYNLVSMAAAEDEIKEFIIRTGATEFDLEVSITWGDLNDNKARAAIEERLLAEKPELRDEDLGDLEAEINSNLQGASGNLKRVMGIVYEVDVKTAAGKTERLTISLGPDTWLGVSI